MAKTQMHVRTVLSVVPQLPAAISVLFRGNHGIGKSQVVAQLRNLIKESDPNLGDFPLIDRRLSQLTEGDIIGLPSTDGEVTRFNPPDWYKQACNKPACLFLDELNRATPEVMQAAFQIVLDRTLNGQSLHPQTRVFAAVNDSGAYTVNEIDPALLDRFWVVDLNPDVDDWLTWARNVGIHDHITGFIAANPKFLDPHKNVEPGAVSPSRRSYERLDMSLKCAGIEEKPNDDRFYSIAAGFLGVEAAQAFSAHAKNNDLRVLPEEVVNSYKKVQKKVQKMSIERQVDLTAKLSDYFAEKPENRKFSDKVLGNLDLFMQDITPETRLTFFTNVIRSCGTDTAAMAAFNAKVNYQVLQLFGVNADGTGEVKVPDFLEKK